MRIESHWIASATARKKRPTSTLSLSCGKSIMPNAAAIPKRVMFSTATVFIGDLVKSNGINRLMIDGIVTTQRKSSSRRQSIQIRSDDHDFVFIGISFCRVSAGDFSREFGLLLLNEHFCGAGADGGIGRQTCDVGGAKEDGALPVFAAGQREMNQRARRGNEIGVLNDNGEV